MNSHVMFLSGHATADSEELETKAGKKFYKFSLAVNQYKGEELGEETHYYDISCFGGQSLKQGEKVKKGEAVTVMGTPNISSYISNEGEARTNLGLSAGYVRRI